MNERKKEKREQISHRKVNEISERKREKWNINPIFVLNCKNQINNFYWQGIFHGKTILVKLNTLGFRNAYV
jgi:hypothetical protein